MSDLDPFAVGKELYLPRLELRDGLLVSVSMQPFATHWGSFELPETVCEAVPGWREGLATSLVREAWAEPGSHRAALRRLGRRRDDRPRRNG